MQADPLDYQVAPGSDPDANTHKREALFVPSDPDRTLEWITALSAARIDYRLSRRAAQWRLHVPEAQAEAAQVEIAACMQQADWPPPEPAEPPPVHADGAATWMAFWCVHALALFHVGLGPYEHGKPVFEAACADAERIAAGEWWRSVTALTIHADWPHFVANAFFMFFLCQAVFRALGRGMGLLLLLLGGAAGNMAVAYVVAPPYRSVGASTMGFAALGILSVHQALLHYRTSRNWRTVARRGWIPLAAGLALLGMMGTGPRSDLAAHAFGFGAGALLALPLAMFGPPRLSGRGQWALVFAGLLVLLAGWLAAAMRIAAGPG